MGKWSLHLFSVAFDPILFILAGNKDKHKLSDKFEFWPDRIFDYRVSLKISHRLIMGKWCLHASLFIFDQIIIKFAGNQDRHKSSVKPDFGPNQTTLFGVICPWVTKILHFWAFISPKPVGQSRSNFMCSITGVGERLHKVSGQIGSKLWFPLTYDGENDVSTFSQLFLIRSFLYLRVKRTCIKSRTSSNFGQIGPLTTELAALEA